MPIWASANQEVKLNVTIVNAPVLVLNQNYEPLNICRVRRAVVLLYWGKAELLENGRGKLCSTGSSVEIPSVIRLVYMIRRPRHTRRLTKFEILERDRYTCQYCGRQTTQLTLDHVIPRQHSGPHTWENVVAACLGCNCKKAGRTPAEAKMKLLTRPAPPRDNGALPIPYHVLRQHREWQKYLPEKLRYMMPGLEFTAS
jgi:5-methylcytosine-specific restriction endonuclease McrA